VNVMKIFVILVLVCVFCFPMAVMARRDTGPPEWTFDDVAELADWQDHYNLDPTSASTITKVRDSKGIERNVLRIVATGDNPYIYPGGAVPNWEPFSGYDYRTIYIGVRVEESDTWTVDYITGKDGEYDEGQSREFRVEAEPGFVDLEFEMQWSGMIRGFRIHPGATRNKMAEIDYVSLRGPVIVTQSPRRLATTWGRIKDLL
jgi:hypothetical protein